MRNLDGRALGIVVCANHSGRMEWFGVPSGPGPPKTAERGRNRPNDPASTQKKGPAQSNAVNSLCHALSPWFPKIKYLTETPHLLWRRDLRGTLSRRAGAVGWQPPAGRRRPLRGPAPPPAASCRSWGGPRRTAGGALHWRWGGGD